MNKWSDAARYQKQTNIIREVLAHEDHSLDALVAALREGGESALYLCGSRVDNDFCLSSEDLGFLLTALPQDGPKAAEPGYHPGSTEVYVTFQGSLTIEYLEQGSLHAREVHQFDVVVLPPGQCHRIRHQPENCAASFVVKTNLRHKPAVVRCADCGYFPDPRACALHESWRGELNT